MPASPQRRASDGAALQGRHKRERDRRSTKGKASSDNIRTPFKPVLLAALSACVLGLLLFYYNPARSPASGDDEASSSSTSRTSPHTRPSSHQWSDAGCAQVILNQQQRLLEVFSEESRMHKHVAILGYPSHENKGDSAIWVGEKVLLAALGIETVYQASWMTYTSTALEAAAKKHPDLLVLLHGGGNLGDLYPWEMDGRLKVVEQFHNLPIRFFPQSIHFEDPQRMLQVRDRLARHPDLIIVVRDVPSLQKANDVFAPAGIAIKYAPDAAFMIGARP